MVELPRSAARHEQQRPSIILWNNTARAQAGAARMPILKLSDGSEMCAGGALPPEGLGWSDGRYGGPADAAPAYYRPSPSLFPRLTAPLATRTWRAPPVIAR
jgi:hypothetical protein